MKNYFWGECMLDIISKVEFYKLGAPLNWCKYLLKKMLQACVDVHERATYFIYGYFLVTFTMRKWKAPAGHTLVMGFFPCDFGSCHNKA
jgi:hypothetical protein